MVHQGPQLGQHRDAGHHHPGNTMCIQGATLNSSMACTTSKANQHIFASSCRTHILIHYICTMHRLHLGHEANCERRCPQVSVPFQGNPYVQDCNSQEAQLQFDSSPPACGLVPPAQLSLATLELHDGAAYHRVPELLPALIRLPVDGELALKENSSNIRVSKHPKLIIAIEVGSLLQHGIGILVEVTAFTPRG